MGNSITDNRQDIEDFIINAPITWFELQEVKYFLKWDRHFWYGMYDGTYKKPIEVTDEEARQHITNKRKNLLRS